MRRHKSTVYRRAKRKLGEDFEDVDYNYDSDAELSSNSEGEVRIAESGPTEGIPSPPPAIIQNTSPDLSLCSPEDTLNGEVSWDLGALSLSYSSDSSNQSLGSEPRQPTHVSYCGNAKPSEDLSVLLRKWAVGNNISNSSLTKLLHILQPVESSLPKDARTLLNINPVTGLVKMGTGIYYNFGLGAVLKNVFDYNPSVSTLLLSFNIDGLPLFKSTEYECWPILCLVKGLLLPPMMSSVWCGPGKPTLNSFFEDFVPELRNLLMRGIFHKGRHYNVKVKAIICDALALAFVKGTVGHGSYFGCGKCFQKRVV
ncbi:hypothetical protein FOCC_FOCC013425 [Frankliniella occidentalis]|nr:hypothetical protein FOCC_FOCC013425 [Frankliniella occidentalis]